MLPTERLIRHKAHFLAVMGIAHGDANECAMSQSSAASEVTERG